MQDNEENQLTHLLAVLELLHPETGPLEAAAVSQIWKNTNSFSCQEQVYDSSPDLQCYTRRHTKHNNTEIKETVQQNNTLSEKKVEM